MISLFGGKIVNLYQKEVEYKSGIKAGKTENKVFVELDCVGVEETYASVSATTRNVVRFSVPESNIHFDKLSSLETEMYLLMKVEDLTEGSCGFVNFKFIHNVFDNDDPNKARYIYPVFTLKPKATKAVL